MTRTTRRTLTERAIAAARRYRDTVPHEFADRDAVRIRWDRRTMTAAHIATALGVGVDTVLVQDDPDRHYGIGTSRAPGDLIEVASDDGPPWHFVPSLTGFDPLWGWLLLGQCPSCEALAVPVARVAGLADLGAHLDPGTDTVDADTVNAEALPPEFHGDPGHRARCRYGPRASDVNAG
jgi:hypothetical protein